MTDPAPTLRVRNVTGTPLPLEGGHVLPALAYATVPVTERVKALLASAWLVQVTEDQESGVETDAVAQLHALAPVDDEADDTSPETTEARAQVNRGETVPLDQVRETTDPPAPKPRAPRRRKPTTEEPAS